MTRAHGAAWGLALAAQDDSFVRLLVLLLAVPIAILGRPQPVRAVEHQHSGAVCT